MFPIYIQSTPLRCVLYSPFYMYVSVARGSSLCALIWWEEVYMYIYIYMPQSWYHKLYNEKRKKKTGKRKCLVAKEKRRKKDVIELISGLVYTYRVCHDIVKCFNLPQGLRKLPAHLYSLKKTGLKLTRQNL